MIKRMVERGAEEKQRSFVRVMIQTVGVLFCFAGLDVSGPGSGEDPGEPQRPGTVPEGQVYPLVDNFLNCI